MALKTEQDVREFYRYPPPGVDDWRYAFATAEVRSLETRMLSQGDLVDMANAGSYEQVIEMLSSRDYGIGQGGAAYGETEGLLMEKRSAVRGLFEQLMIDEEIVRLFRSRVDYSNMRLALRRNLTDKPLGTGTDYSDEGNVAAEEFVEVFENENYDVLPDYIGEAVERAVLAYYQDKDIRQIDYAIDSAEGDYRLRMAIELENVFLLGLFRIEIDLTNIRTMLRLKFSQSDRRDVFGRCGYVEPERLGHGVEADYEGLGQLFFASPYFELVESAANYVASKKSFLRVEYNCEDYMRGFLKSTDQITAGPQPVIAYLLMKENEIRMVRLLLAAKKNNLDRQLILDRIGG